MAKKRIVLLAGLGALAAVTAAILVFPDLGPRAAAERACKDGLANVRVSIQPADQVKYPGQRVFHLDARDGSFSHFRGIRSDDSRSAEQLFMDDCIFERLNPDTD